MTPLTERVLRYQQTGAGLAELIDQIRILVYRFPAGQQGFDEQDGAEFLLRFAPRIRGLIERYRQNGSFESYLAATLRWQIKTLAAERTSRKIRLATFEFSGTYRLMDERDPECICMEAHEAPGGVGGDREDVTLGPGQARRLVYLALKLTERLDEKDYRRVARAAGVEPEWLVSCWQQLRHACFEQRERRRAFRARRDRAWFRMQCLQFRITEAPTDRLGDLTRQLQAWRRRYEQARRGLLHMQDGPTHAQIAHVLGVAKGTVDSGVFYAKRELKEKSHDSELVAALTNA
jgi:hypothetical protein